MRLTLFLYYYFQTTSVHALARQLLGSSYSNGVLELNASDARGIDVSGIDLLHGLKLYIYSRRSHH